MIFGAANNDKITIESAISDLMEEVVVLDLISDSTAANDRHASDVPYSQIPNDIKLINFLGTVNSESRMPASTRIAPAADNNNMLYAISHLLRIGAEPLFTFSEPQLHQESSSMPIDISLLDLRIIIEVATYGINYEKLTSVADSAIDGAREYLACGTIVYVLGLRLSAEAIAKWGAAEYVPLFRAIDTKFISMRPWFANLGPTDKMYLPFEFNNEQFAEINSDPINIGATEPSIADGANDIARDIGPDNTRDSMTAVDISIIPGVVSVKYAQSMYATARQYVDFMFGEYMIMHLTSRTKFALPHPAGKISKTNGWNDHARSLIIYPDKEIADAFMTVGITRFGTMYMSSIQNTIQIYRLGDLIYSAITSNSIYQSNAVHYDVVQDFTADIILRSRYENAYREIYGISKYNKLRPPNSTSSGFLRAMTPAEVDAVKKYVSAVMARVSEHLNNNCFHIAALRDYMRAQSVADVVAAFDHLKTFMAPESMKYKRDSQKYTGYTTCKICKFQIICSHELIKVRYMSGDITRYDDLVTEYAPYVYEVNDDAAIENSAGAGLEDFATLTTDRTYNTLCDICGAVLYQDMGERAGAAEIVFTNYIDNSEIWRIATHIFYTYVTFSGSMLYDKITILRMMVNTCMPILNERIQRIYDQAEIITYTIIEANMLYASYLANMENATSRGIRFNMHNFMANIPIREKARAMRLIQTYRDRLAYVEPPKINNMHKIYNIYNNPIITMVAKYTGSRIGAEFLHKYFDLSLLGFAYIERIRRKRDLISVNVTSRKMYSKLPVAANTIAQSKSANATTIVGGVVTDHLRHVRDMIGERLCILLYNRLVKYLQQIELLSEVKAIEYGSPEMITHKMFTPPIIQKEIEDLDDAYTNANAALKYKPHMFLPVCGTFSTVNLYTLALGRHFADNGTYYKWSSIAYGADDNLLAISSANYGKIWRESLSSNSYIRDFYTADGTSRSSAMTESADKNGELSNVILAREKMAILLSYFAKKCPETDADHNYSAEGDAKYCRDCKYMSLSDIEYAAKYKQKYESVQHLNMNTPYISIMSVDTADAESDTVDMIINNEDDRDDNRAAITRSATEILAAHDKLPQLITEMVSKFNVGELEIIHLGAIDAIKYEELLSGAVQPKYPTSAQNTKIYTMKSYLCALKIELLKTNQNLSAEMISFDAKFDDVLDSLVLSATDTRMIMDWMRAILYETLLNLHGSNPAMASTYLTSILYKDRNNCIYEKMDRIARSREVFTDQVDKTVDEVSDDGDDAIEGITE
jgi:hypothetical protein